jgi:hypothetical protein
MTGLNPASTNSSKAGKSIIDMIVFSEFSAEFSSNSNKSVSEAARSHSLDRLNCYSNTLGLQTQNASLKFLATRTVLVFTLDILGLF